MFTLWKKILRKILDDNENAWEFERYGSERSDNFSNFFVVKKPFKYLHGVVRGKFT